MSLTIDLKFELTDVAHKALAADPPFQAAWSIPALTAVPALGDEVSFGDGTGPVFKVTERAFVLHAPESMTIKIELDLERPGPARPQH